MKKSILGWALLPALVLVLGLAGCKPGDDDGQGNNPPPAPPAQVYDIKVESRPDTTPEFQRIHYYLPGGGREVKMEIQYRDGRTEQYMYRQDGSLEELVELHIHSQKVQSRTKFAADGKTRLESTSWRIGGELDSSTVYNADGSSRTVAYKVDGKRIHSETLTDTSGAQKITVYRSDGKTLWAKIDRPSQYSARVEYYDDAGKLTQIRELNSSKMVITVLDDTGKVVMKQEWSGYWSSWSGPSYNNLQNTEKYEPDGSTVSRRIEFEYYYSRPRVVYDYKDGARVKEYSFNYDGSVKSEQTLQDDGTWATQSYSNGEKQLDPPLTDSDRSAPAYQDPLVDNPSNRL
ncbi:MAG: hypothetical protein IPM23_04245 [Candidatus Melainabacteria bacterium]|nr:hypothetical protein [Candidatus Melainabacteria bacterium]